MEKSVVWILFLATICQMVDLSATHPCLRFAEACFRRGKCIPTSSIRYSCKCNLGYEGQYCEKVYDPCVEEPDLHHCHRRGTCVNIGAKQSQCKCHQGFGGFRCRDKLSNSGCGLDVDKVAVCPSGNPYDCKPGYSCELLSNVYQCTCDTEDGHNKCFTVRTPCSRPDACSNGGTCIEKDRFYYVCACPPGYLGTRCREEESPGCPRGTPVGCKQGYNCEIYHNLYKCECSTDNGYKCFTAKPPCSKPDACKNGGTCVERSRFDYVCTCNPGYTGSFCETGSGGCGLDVDM